ncbi:MAG: type II toxin-antitoxin system HicB family antitoxin [Phycisphaerae bacterium]|nr:type II toxin-antitoxin system HicB family antitoxin [Phycisphaerae bacterium]
MKKKGRSFTKVVRRESDGWVAVCTEVDVASQGDTAEDARENLREAVRLFLEAASKSEIRRRVHS